LIKEYAYFMLQKENANIAIFWDIENVTPSSGDTLFIDGLKDYADNLGSVLTGFAYAEWNKGPFVKLGPMLLDKAHYFRLIHVPHKRSGKNSADMQLVNDALELLQFYPHIDTYIVVTGDSDFRPLLLSLRKSGKKIHIICDGQTASQDLLELANDFKDYRDILLGLEVNNDDEPTDLVAKDPEYWFDRLVETVQFLKDKGKQCYFSSVKNKMKLLNSDFDESKLGYKTFTHFIKAASQKNYVTIVQTEDERLIDVVKKTQDSSQDGLQNALNQLTICMQEMGIGNAGDGFHNFADIGMALKQKGVNLAEMGFGRLIKFMQMAEKRAIVENKRESTTFYGRLVTPIK
jgi:uncharacterized LabA/DUF88 family protein